ncbi:glycosyltransferase family 2 protein [Bacillus sp. ISL-18]|uniref:glycosyltransferase family 2 protein n=1 Tax=Bacillus sp. ISL-18 TaxID=2819118 RepID=UPI0027E162EA|nr:glycosyltransferase family 2 protein [Bacillus sp. ISL-18]
MNKVSIIIPAYNSMKTISRSLTSCLEQTYNNIEIVVIDDGSKDQTREIVNLFNDSRIKYYYFENSGRSMARNRGIERATGRYIQFLDSDDTLEKDMVERAVAILESNPEVDAVQCGTNYWKENKLVSVSKVKPLKNIKKVLLRKNIFPIHSVVFKSELAANFPDGLSHCEDWYFWVKTLYNAMVFFQTDYYGSNVYIHENNTMANHYDMLMGELYILLVIKKYTKDRSILRDLKFLKQYLVILAKYDDNSIKQKDISPYEIMPVLRSVDALINNLGLIKIMKHLLNVKNRFFKREQLY